MGWERTLITIKPDAVKRGLVGEIIKHFEDKGLIFRNVLRKNRCLQPAYFLLVRLMC